MTDTAPDHATDTLLASVRETFALVTSLRCRWAELAVFNAADSPSAVIRLHSAGDLEAWLDAQQLKPYTVSDGRRTRMHITLNGVLVTWPHAPAAAYPVEVA